MEYAQSKGFRAKVYKVTTDDGYILTVHRLLPANGSVVAGARPVILQHGILETGIDWINGSPFVVPPGNASQMGDNLGFDLLLTGRYDPWLANSRGNRYSQEHINLTREDTDFWKFSFDQMAQYDLPATIRMVLGETGSQTVGFIGFSQGSTSMFALMSMEPEYADIVQPFLALAPVTYWDHVSSALRLLAPAEPMIRRMPGEFIISKRMVNLFLPPTCRLPLAPYICSTGLFLVVGFDYSHMNMSRTPVYASYVPSGTSNWQLCHFLQLSNQGNFSKFNYGEDGNLEAYNSTTPPLYPLHRIPSHAKIGFYAGNHDAFGNAQDVDRLRQVLTKRAGIKLIDDYLVPVNWNHLDFLWGMGVGELVYRRLIERLDEHSRPLQL